MYFKKSFYRLLTTGIFSLSAIIYSSCTNEKAAASGTPSERSAVSVTGYVPRPVVLEHNIYSTGSVLPNEVVDIQSEISGRVTGIYFKEDSPVKKGDLLVKINDRDLQAQLKKVRVQEKLAKDEEARNKQLLDIQGISQEEYNRSLTALESAQADAGLLYAQIEKTEIRAPFSGTIGLRNISNGSYVSPSTLITTLQDTDPVKVQFSVPEEYYHLVKKGSEISFSLSGSERNFTGEIYAISPSLNESSRSLTIKALADNKDQILTPGAFVKVELTLQEIENALLVPSDAILAEIGKQKVFVAKNGKAVPVDVTTGLHTDHEVEIKTGLSPDDTVIVTGLLQLEEGTNVTVRKDILKQEEVRITAKTQ